MRPSTFLTLLVTTGSEIWARSIFSSRTLPPPAGFTPIVTSVPSGPLIFSVETSLLSPAIESPSTETIRSPGSSPARAGGESGKTLVDPQALLHLR